MTLLQLIEDLDPSFDVLGCALSIKLDGQRCFWDGGITRGKPKADCPWANTMKDGRYRDEQIATGLWSRYGHVIHAPDWWLDKLPLDRCLDGELYSDQLKREELFSIVKTQVPDSRWNRVSYNIFELVPYNLFFTDRKLGIGAKSWGHMVGSKCRDHYFPGFANPPGPSAALTFRSSLTLLDRGNWQNDVIQYIQNQTVTDTSQVRNLFDYVQSINGEGIVVRTMDRWWTPKRVDWVRRLKTLRYGEGVVVDVTEGLGRLDGMIGALVLESGLKVAGLGDAARSLDNWVGKRIKYAYRETSKYGVPLEARFKEIL